MRSPKSILSLLLLCCGLLTLLAGSVAADPEPVLSTSPDHFAFGPINVGAELGEPGIFTLTNPGTEPVLLGDPGCPGRCRRG